MYFLYPAHTTVEDDQQINGNINVEIKSQSCIMRSYTCRDSGLLYYAAATEASFSFLRGHPVVVTQ